MKARSTDAVHWAGKPCILERASASRVDGSLRFAGSVSLVGHCNDARKKDWRIVCRIDKQLHAEFEEWEIWQWGGMGAALSAVRQGKGEAKIMVDVNKLLTNPQLVAAIEQAAQVPSTEHEQALLEALSAARFLMVFEGELQHDGPDAKGLATLQKDSNLRLPMLADAEGRSWYLAFTDWLAVQAWREQPGLQALIVPYSDWPALLAETEYAGFVINPSSHNLPVGRAHVLAKDGAYTVQEGTKVLLGEPKEYPHALVEALKRKLKTMLHVRAAGLLLMINGEEQSFLAVVDFEGDRAAVNSAIGQVAAPLLPPGMFLDIVSAREAFGREAIQNREPFYDKKKRFFPWRLEK